MTNHLRPRGQISWTRDEMKAVALNAGKMSLEAVTREVNAIGGNDRGNGSIKKKACSMGYSLVVKAI